MYILAQLNLFKSVTLWSTDWLTNRQINTSHATNEIFTIFGSTMEIIC